MNIAVILKQVPDTEAVVKPDPAKPGAILETDIKFILNTYDEYAVEEAVRIVEKTGGEAVGVCIGPERAEAAIRSALAMGLSRALWVSEPDAVSADVITQAKVLAAAIKTLSPGLVLCGREMIDTQEDAIASAAAQFLDMPQVLNAAKITIDGEKAVVLREVESASLEIEAKLPAVISCGKGLNEPRYPNLMSIKKAKNKEIKKLTLAELGLQAGPAKARIAALEAPAPRAKGVRVEGEVASMVAQGVDWLMKVAKVV
ncbi:MAG: electron transfer flavoprotein subunit beta/FixA family protein [Elusimicrobiota bacterium]|jgi:electron transfer flavoprotein beta subunit